MPSMTDAISARTAAGLRTSVGDADDVRTLLRDLAHRVFERAGIFVGECHVAARACQPTRDPAADTDAGAGDQRALAGESELDSHYETPRRCGDRSGKPCSRSRYIMRNGRISPPPHRVPTRVHRR